MNIVFRIAAALAVLACSATIALAQQKVKTPIVGYLSTEAAHSTTGNTYWLRRGLEELGYAEGKNIALVFRHADGQSERLPDLAADLLRQEVNVIVTADPSATRAAKEATSSVPIVMLFDPDPVRAGFVASLARPGGNITGNSSASPRLIGDQIKALKVLLPNMSRIAVLGNSTEAGNPQALKEAETAARNLGLQLAPLDVRGPKDVEPALDAAAKANADAILVLATPIWIIYEGRFLELVAERRLPAIYFDPGFVGLGGLMSYSVNDYELSERAVAYVVKILKGGKPADMPVEQPTRFHLSFNMDTAKKMGLAVPQELLASVTNLIDGSSDNRSGNTMRLDPMMVWYLIGSALLLVFFVAVIRNVRRHKRLVEQSTSWPSVSGTVTRSSVKPIEEEDERSGYDRSGSRSYSTIGYRVEVAYRYEVGGRTYECDRVTFKVGEMFATDAAAQAIADRYKVGESVVVFHDPANPKEATLTRGAG
ncbi:MAG: DUF3592 domain-containing protein [Burkholderiales bacterium]|nr:DUF3592 domain-containing protein [Burkholderiales bacterium]